MAADAHAAADFYGTTRGVVAARLLRERLLALWPDLRGQSVLGIGFAAPYLRLWRAQAERCIAVTPAQMGATRWPLGQPCLACTAEEDALPFQELSFDRVLLVHGLEAAENARRLLRETWRVLKDDGRLIVVAPNRAGIWAYSERTPFGHGQPYSFGQLGRLLAASLYRVERRDTVLWVPPVERRLVLRSAELFERSGRRLMPGMAGLIVTEAVKDVYAALPLKPSPRRRLVLAEAA
ncbi:MAG TPA: methyltransferase domain-containing protein [Acetobacteraceae bacterium]|nr:methyltransferase domain-containing protein [Acetobacteraceae bacterium]